MAAGNLGRARELLEGLASSMPPGTARADALRQLATVRYRQDSPAVAAELLTHAREEAGRDAALQACIERDLAWAVIACGDVRDARNHTRAALELVDESEDPELHGELLAADALTSFLLGDGFNEAQMQHSIELDDTDPAVPVEWRPSMMLASMQRWSGDLAGAQRRLQALHRQIADAGDEASLPYLLAQLSETETLAGELRGRSSTPRRPMPSPGAWGRSRSGPPSCTPGRSPPPTWAWRTRLAGWLSRASRCRTRPAPS